MLSRLDVCLKIDVYWVSESVSNSSLYVSLSTTMSGTSGCALNAGGTSAMSTGCNTRR